MMDIIRLGNAVLQDFSDDQKTTSFFSSDFESINRLLTEHEGRTGDSMRTQTYFRRSFLLTTAGYTFAFAGYTEGYWPKVVAVRAKCSEVGTVTTEGQYSPVPSRAIEASKLFIIWHSISDSKTPSRGLHLKGLRPLSVRPHESETYPDSL